MINKRFAFCFVCVIFLYFLSFLVKIGLMLWAIVMVGIRSLRLLAFLKGSLMTLTLSLLAIFASCVLALLVAVIVRSCAFWCWCSDNNFCLLCRVFGVKDVS